MAIKMAELDALRADYTAVHGHAFRSFMCPITLRDEAAELMDGHILNEAFVTARRTTVIQRKDVDNYFGSTIERDVINLLNNAAATKEDWFKQAKNVFATRPDGQEVQLIHPSKIKDGVFPKINLINDDGSVWASGYFKGDVNSLKDAGQIYVGFRYKARDGAVLGSWMKAAYLTMFKLLGYRYVYSGAAAFLRRPLSEFVLGKESVADAERRFGHFAGACGSIVGPQASDLRDTLGDKVILVRVTEGVAFGLSVLFRINNTIHTVTVPLGETAEGHYQNFLNDPHYPHCVLCGVLEGRELRVAPTPISLPVSLLDKT